MAIVEFEDMECPDCGAANPLLREASEKYHIPWVRHDFPLPFHAWSMQAAINARWFDTRSKNWAMSIATRFSPTRPPSST